MRHAGGVPFLPFAERLSAKTSIKVSCFEQYDSKAAHTKLEKDKCLRN
jgi:hypothetical protein